MIKFNELNKLEKGIYVFGVSGKLIGLGMMAYGTGMLIYDKIKERKISKELGEENIFDEMMEEANEILDVLLNEED